MKKNKSIWIFCSFAVASLALRRCSSEPAAPTAPETDEK